MIDPDPVARLVDVFRHRAQHPRGVYALREFRLTDREAEIVSIVLATVAIEIDHAVEEGRQNAVMAQVPGLRLVG